MSASTLNLALDDEWHHSKALRGSVTGWQRNLGLPPVTEQENGPPMLYVYVRLHNGSEPPQPWPVLGRPVKTRWTLTGCPFDIIQWRPA